MDKIELSKSIASNLLRIDAIRISPEKPFTWASGIISPIYCDNRLSLSNPGVRDLIKKGLANLAKDFDYDLIGGVATAGIPHGAILADYLDEPFIYVRDKVKGHGKQNQIEGKMLPGQKVLLIEDLISTGGSSLKAVESIRAAGGVVSGVLAIFTYGFLEACRNFEKANCRFATLSDYNTLLREAVSMEKIDETKLEILEKWSLDPKNWFK